MKPSFPTVLDSTIIAAARSCLQKANLEFFEHWKPREPSVHLHAGAAYAAGMEAARSPLASKRYLYTTATSNARLTLPSPSNAPQVPWSSTSPVIASARTKRSQ